MGCTVYLYALEGKENNLQKTLKVQMRLDGLIALGRGGGGFTGLDEEGESLRSEWKRQEEGTNFSLRYQDTNDLDILVTVHEKRGWNLQATTRG